MTFQSPTFEQSCLEGWSFEGDIVPLLMVTLQNNTDMGNPPFWWHLPGEMGMFHDDLLVYRRVVQPDSCQVSKLNKSTKSWVPMYCVLNPGGGFRYCIIVGSPRFGEDVQFDKCSTTNQSIETVNEASFGQSLLIHVCCTWTVPKSISFSPFARIQVDIIICRDIRE